MILKVRNFNKQRSMYSRDSERCAQCRMSYNKSEMENHKYFYTCRNCISYLIKTVPRQPDDSKTKKTKNKK